MAITWQGWKQVKGWWVLREGNVFLVSRWPFKTPPPQQPRAA